MSQLTLRIGEVTRQSLGTAGVDDVTAIDRPLLERYMADLHTPFGGGNQQALHIGQLGLLRTGTAPRAAASFRNLSLNTFRLAGRANIAYARRDVFAAYGI